MEFSKNHPDCLLFVYGTLRRDVARLFNRNGNFQPSIYDLLAQHSEFIDNASFQGKLYDVGGYPGAVKSTEPGDRVFGELYSIFPEKATYIFERLDAYEACGLRFAALTEYTREKCTVIPAFSGQPLTAWMYLYNRPVEKFTWIESGDYLNYLIKTIENTPCPK